MPPLPDAAAAATRSLAVPRAPVVAVATAVRSEPWPAIPVVSRPPRPLPPAARRQAALREPVAPAVDARLERILAALADAADPHYRELVAAFEFGRYRNVAEIGGGNGRFACILAERFGHLACRSLDVPAVRPIAERAIRDRRLANRVRAEDLDVFGAPFPTADVIVISHLLHDWNVHRRQLLVAKAGRALVRGGVLIALDTAAPVSAGADASGRVELDGAVIEFGDSLDVTGADLQRWCAQAGFQRCETLALRGGARASIAYR